jgi:hypothetical protein
MEEKRVIEPTTDKGGKRPQVEGRRRMLSNDHSPPSRKGLQDRMEIPQEKQKWRWQPGNEERGQHIRDNMDEEGVNLEWNIGGEDGLIPT